MPYTRWVAYALGRNGSGKSQSGERRGKRYFRRWTRRRLKQELRREEQ